MRPLRSALFLVALSFSVAAPAQDTTAKHCEFGFNTTLLLKQVFNLSNNTFAMLPYDLTYKRINGNHAWRFGLGVDVDLQNVTTETSGGGTVSGPDPVGPTYSRNGLLSLREGWEKRFDMDKRFTAWLGVDLVEAYGNNSAQSISVFNNLPSNYSYSRTTLSGNTIEAGLGPVAGIQFALTKRLSLFTEAPLYAVFHYEKQETENYTNQYFGGGYNAELNKETITTSKLNLSFTMPVTLYLALKF